MNRESSKVLQSYRKRYLKFNEKGWNVERFFLITAILLGIGYMMINTPNSVYDERSHFLSAYHYSDVLLGQPFSMEDGTFQIRVEDLKSLHYSEYAGMETLKQVGENFTWFSDENEMTTFTFGVSGNFWQYLPQIVGITLGRLLHLGHLPVYYLARMLNFAWYIVLTWMAIKIVPIGKMPMAMIALLPISLQQAASNSYDASLFAVGFLLVALLLYAVYSQGEVGKKFWIFTGIVTWLFAAQKLGVTIVVLGILFLIPKERFGSRKKWFGFFGYVAGIYLLSLVCNDLTYYLLFPIGGTESYNGTEVKELYSLSDLLGNIPGFFGIMGNSVVEKAHYYFFSAFGGYLGSFALMIPDSYILELVAVICLAALSAGDSRDGISEAVPGKHRIWLSVLFLIQFLIYEALFFICYTPKGEDVIWGVQGRYFIPVLLLVFIGLKGRKIRFRRNYDRTIGILYVLLSVLIFSVLVFTIIASGDSIRNMSNPSVVSWR